jgi:hypothetical protein
MAVTELEEIQALLERALPDPRGFAQRVLLQFMARVGESGAGTSSPVANAFYAAAGGESAASKIVITPEEPDRFEEPDGINILLAAALGACECWGVRADCDLCHGLGSAGWTEPVPELFDEFVGPAIARLPLVSPDDLARSGTARPDRPENHRTEQGEHS